MDLEMYDGDEISFRANVELIPESICEKMCVAKHKTAGTNHGGSCRIRTHLGVSVLEQLSLEEWLLKQTKLKQVDHPVLIDKMTSCQLDYHCRFMITSQRDADFVMAGSQKLKEHGS
jgi:hypothetical protein